MKGMFQRSRIYPIILITVVFIVYQIREAGKPSMITITGTTMGTIVYSIKYFDEQGRDFKSQVDSILVSFNQSLNHYMPDSEISQFNDDTVFVFKSPYFYQVLVGSEYVFDESGGAFDPTLGPLINAWGFGPGEALEPDSAMVDSLLSITGFEKISFNKTQVSKLSRSLKLDFSAIAKGYAVDVLFEFLVGNGIDDLMVEIGGEVRCGGKNVDKPWAIGIIDPRSDMIKKEVFKTVPLQDKAMATSANNFNYHEIEGQRVVHTINPDTGFPIVHQLLSASVIAPDCMKADGFATAFMVLGLDRSMEIINSTQELEALLIYSDESGSLQTFISDGLKNQLSPL